jgi:hypothetical protein
VRTTRNVLFVVLMLLLVGASQRRASAALAWTWGPGYGYSVDECDPQDCGQDALEWCCYMMTGFYSNPCGAPLDFECSCNEDPGSDYAWCSLDEGGK